MTTDNRTRRWVLALAAVASFMVALDTLVVSTALTTIQRDLTASVAQLEWTVNAYNLTFAVLLLPASAIGDRLGRRRVFAAGLLAFSLASAACALAPDVGTLIAARAIQGAAAAFVMPLALALVGAAFPPERRGSAMGALQGLTGLAVASGPVIGGAVAQGIDWPWIFWVNVPVGLLAVPLVLARIPESVGTAQRIDLRGVALVTAGALGIVWGLVRGNGAGWGSAEVLASLLAGAALVAGFVVWQRRAAEPLLPPRLFRSRAFAAGNAASFFMIAALFSTVFFLAQFLQTTLGYGALGAGLRLLPWTATLFFVAPLAGALVDRVGERPLLVVGLTMQAIGLGWIALIAAPDLDYIKMVPALMIAGAGISMALPAAQSAVVSAVVPDDIGKAAGTNSMLRELGGVFGIAIAVAVFAGAGAATSPQAFSDGFVPALATSAGL
ncbi:MAG: drug resistance transporter, EmrB/QacA subfamily, partial [Conexibacter sp.]|nr:drug resistance transporter, EmrB/QacA subfamily [Conexibacter sp.]